MWRFAVHGPLSGTRMTAGGEGADRREGGDCCKGGYVVVAADRHSDKASK